MNAPTHRLRAAGADLPRASQIQFLAVVGIAATFLALLTTAQAGFALLHEGQDAPWTGLLKARLVDWYCCALFLPVLCWLARRWTVTPKTWVRALPIHLLAAVPIAIAKESLFVAIGNLFRPGVFDLSRILAEDFSYEVIVFWALSGLAHALMFHRLPRPARTDHLAAGARDAGSETIDGITVRTRLGTRVIPIRDIEYIDAQGNYARLVTPNGRYLLRESMNQLENRLGDEFLRVHRRIILRVDQVVPVERRPNGK